MSLLDWVEGIKKTDEQMLEAKEWSAEDEGNAKLQKVIRKKLQSDDDPDTPFGYRLGKGNNILSHALKFKFDKNPDDARSKSKTPEHIEKMQAARKKIKEEYIDKL